MHFLTQMTDCYVSSKLSSLLLGAHFGQDVTMYGVFQILNGRITLLAENEALVLAEEIVKVIASQLSRQSWV